MEAGACQIAEGAFLRTGMGGVASARDTIAPAGGEGERNVRE